MLGSRAVQNSWEKDLFCTRMCILRQSPRQGDGIYENSLDSLVRKKPSPIACAVSDTPISAGPPSRKGGVAYSGEKTAGGRMMCWERGAQTAVTSLACHLNPCWKRRGMGNPLMMMPPLESPTLCSSFLKSPRYAVMKGVNGWTLRLHAIWKCSRSLFWSFQHYMNIVNLPISHHLTH